MHMGDLLMWVSWGVVVIYCLVLLEKRSCGATLDLNILQNNNINSMKNERVA